MNTLKNRNFTLMVIGQIISLFGNAILRFSISLYILDQTGSASTFATILSISFIPTILLSPIGGILADRVSRKHIMITLDFITAAFIFFFSLFALQGAIPIAIIAIMMILLSIIQACYQPSVQSSVPLLVEEEQLMQANGIVIQMNALSNLLGPIIGSILYAFLPFTQLLWIASGTFFISAMIECIMKIPYTKIVKQGSMISTSLKDIREGMHFIYYDRPTLFQVLIILALLNLFLSSLLTVGLPIISNMILALPPIYYGWMQAGNAIGAIAGSILLPLYFKHYTMKSSHRFLTIASLSISFIGIALLFTNARYASYAIILFASVFAMIFATMFNILAQTYLQQCTPAHLLGKVSSFVTMIVMCSYPIGQALYGFLFDICGPYHYVILFVACIFALLISWKTRTTLKKI